MDPVPSVLKALTHITVFHCTSLRVISATVRCGSGPHDPQVEPCYGWLPVLSTEPAAGGRSGMQPSLPAFPDCVQLCSARPFYFPILGFVSAVD